MDGNKVVDCCSWCSCVPCEDGPVSSSSVNMSCAIDYGQIANYDIEFGPRTLVSNMFDRANKKQKLRAKLDEKRS